MKKATGAREKGGFGKRAKEKNRRKGKGQSKRKQQKGKKAGELKRWAAEFWQEKEQRKTRKIQDGGEPRDFGQGKEQRKT